MRLDKVATPPLSTGCNKASPYPESQAAGFYLHPSVSPANDPQKGRLLRASAHIQRGTVILKDVSYATVPTSAWSKSATLVCSNIQCLRHVSVEAASSRLCPRNCDGDVVWCSDICRNADQLRHDYECPWLQTLGQVIRREESTYDFITLWHVVRLLAGRAADAQHYHLTSTSPQPTSDLSVSNWESVLSCCDYLDSWPQPQTEHWNRLIATYLDNDSLLPCSLNRSQLLSLLCKEETNTFGLYTRPTGPRGMVDNGTPRGNPFAVSLYPRAAMFNHSCQPNVSHLPDARGQMIFTAARDIAPGEECTISYFDLEVHTLLRDRQNLVQEQFRFRCTCERCEEEEAQEASDMMENLPFCD